MTLRSGKDQMAHAEPARTAHTPCARGLHSEATDVRGRQRAARGQRRVEVCEEERPHFPGGWGFSSLVSLSQTLDSSPGPRNRLSSDLTELAPELCPSQGFSYHWTPLLSVIRGK